MPSALLNHSYIAVTIALTVYSQLVMRWQVGGAGGFPDDLHGKLLFVAQLLVHPWVVSALAASFGAGISWMMAMTKFEISYAYPFIGLNFILVTLSGVLLFGESLTLSKVFGTLLIVTGIVVVARGQVT